MEQDIRAQIGQLMITLIITWFICKFYKNSTSAPDARYSTFWPRFWTGTVDSVVLWPVGLIAYLALQLNISGSVAALILFLQCLVCLLYTVLMHARFGQTVGKMITQVRVVDNRTEGRITFRQALLREGLPLLLDCGLLGYVEFALITGSLVPKEVSHNTRLMNTTAVSILGILPFLWLAAEILTMLTNKKRRALHDFIAGTVVVRTNTVAESSVSPENYPEDYLIKCLVCGTSMPALETVCSKCGWTYKEEPSGLR